MFRVGPPRRERNSTGTGTCLHERSIDRFRLQAVQQHRIETTRPGGTAAPRAREPVPRREDDPILLVPRDAFGSTAMAAGAAQPDFHEHDAALVLDDQVDFPAATTHVAGKQSCAVRHEVFGSQILGRGAPRLPAAGRGADNASFE